MTPLRYIHLYRRADPVAEGQHIELRRTSCGTALSYISERCRRKAIELGGQSREVVLRWGYGARSIAWSAQLHRYRMLGHEPVLLSEPTGARRAAIHCRGWREFPIAGPVRGVGLGPQVLRNERAV